MIANLLIQIYHSKLAFVRYFRETGTESVKNLSLFSAAYSTLITALQFKFVVVFTKIILIFAVFTFFSVVSLLYLVLFYLFKYFYWPFCIYICVKKFFFFCVTLCDTVRILLTMLLCCLHLTRHFLTKY